MRKGEHATTVVFWKQVASADGEHEDEDENGRRKMFARAFSVFNVVQVDGYKTAPVSVLPETERLAHAEAFIANLGIKTIFGGTQAYYQPSTDTVCMPPFECFRDAAPFYV